MINTIIKIFNVLVFTLLSIMYFTDPENGGLPFVLILFFTVLYDVYYCMVYLIVMRLVEKNSARNWWLSFVALLPFISLYVSFKIL